MAWSAAKISRSCGVHNATIASRLMAMDALRLCSTVLASPRRTRRCSRGSFSAVAPGIARAASSPSSCSACVAACRASSADWRDAASFSMRRGTVRRWSPVALQVATHPGALWRVRWVKNSKEGTHRQTAEVSGATAERADATKHRACGPASRRRSVMSGRAGMACRSYAQHSSQCAKPSHSKGPFTRSAARCASVFVPAKFGATICRHHNRHEIAPCLRTCSWPRRTRSWGLARAAT